MKVYDQTLESIGQCKGYIARKTLESLSVYIIKLRGSIESEFTVSSGSMIGDIVYLTE